MRQLKSSKQSPTPTKYYPMLISVGTMMLQVTRTAAVQALAVAVSVGSQISSKRSSVAVAVAGPCRVHVVDKTRRLLPILILKTPFSVAKRRLTLKLLCAVTVATVQRWNQVRIRKHVRHVVGPAKFPVPWILSWVE